MLMWCRHSMTSMILNPYKFSVASQFKYYIHSCSFLPHSCLCLTILYLSISILDFVHSSLSIFPSRLSIFLDCRLSYLVHKFRVHTQVRGVVPRLKPSPSDLVSYPIFQTYGCHIFLCVWHCMVNLTIFMNVSQVIGSVECIITVNFQYITLNIE